MQSLLSKITIIDNSGDVACVLKLAKTQIIAMLNEGRVGIPVVDLYCKYNIASSTYYKFKSKYDCMNIAEIKKLKSLAKENNRLKQMYADISLEHKILKEVLEKKFPGLIDDK